jgi:hypothetical protein
MNELEIEFLKFESCTEPDRNENGAFNKKFEIDENLQNYSSSVIFFGRHDEEKLREAKSEIQKRIDIVVKKLN